MNWLFYKKLIKKLVIWMERFSPYYLSVHLRSKYIDPATLEKYERYDALSSEYAIVMQGPVVVKGNFTLETLKLYRYVYPNIKLILSTWKIDDTAFVASLNDLGVQLVQNERPFFAGLFNINMQITSTTGGIRHADDGTTKYLLKTRADQRCCKPINFLEYMRFLQENFPLLPDIPLSKRLIIISLDTLKSRLYGVTDFFMFGCIEDMKKYWDIPLDTNTSYEKLIPMETMIRYNIGEGYFVNHFFKTMGFIPNWTVEDSQHFFRLFFSIIDKEQVDLFWFKYNRHFESISDLDMYDFRVWQRRDFADWCLSE